jgi:hypothetical protein
MRHLRKTLFAALFAAAFSAAGEGLDIPFQRSKLDGWTPKIKGHPAGENFANTFRVQDGLLQIRYDGYDGAFKNRFGHLFYKTPFTNYLLRVEYRFVGEQLRTGPAGPGATTAS